MHSPTGKPIPFTVDRLASVTLGEQVASGFRSAIRSGYYAPGDRLPRIQTLAVDLAVSETVVRKAVSLLVGSGDITARRRTGIRVADSPRRTWHAHILFVYFSDTYYFTARNRHFFGLMEGARIRVTAVLLDSHEYRLGMPKIKMALDTQSVDLVALCGPAPGLVSELVQRGVPFISVLNQPVSSHAAGALIEDEKAPLEQMAAHCRECGIGTAAVLIPHAGHMQFVEDAFASRGISCRTLSAAGGSSPPDGLDDIELTGRELMRQLIQAKGVLPDLVYFADDYLGRGGLSAILEAGVQVPDELQVILHVNRGHCPVFTKALTRIEVDPCEHAVKAAALVRQTLDGVQHAKPLVVSSTFIEGGTTRVVASERGIVGCSRHTVQPGRPGADADARCHRRWNQATGA